MSGRPRPAWCQPGPWMLPSLVEVGFQPDVTRLLQGPRGQRCGECVDCKILSPCPQASEGTCTCTCTCPHSSGAGSSSGGWGSARVTGEEATLSLTGVESRPCLGADGTQRPSPDRSLHGLSVFHPALSFVSCWAMPPWDPYVSHGACPPRA